MEEESYLGDAHLLQLGLGEGEQLGVAQAHHDVGVPGATLGQPQDVGYKTGKII